jgi:hypothetical protein
LNNGGHGVRSPADGVTLEEWREVQCGVAHFVFTAFFAAPDGP